MPSRIVHERELELRLFLPRTAFVPSSRLDAGSIDGNADERIGQCSLEQRVRRICPAFFRLG